MDKIQDYELNFWSKFIKEVGKDKFRAHRCEDYIWRIKYLPGLQEESGIGLDVGSGLFSFMEATNLRLFALDPLMSEYQQLIYPISLVHPNITYMNVDCEKLPFLGDTIDFIVCTNVLDHTPNPQTMVNEMYRALKPMHKLYFEVNFTDTEWPGHYGKWNREMVDNMMKNFILDNYIVERDDEHKLLLFYAVYRKP